MRIVFMGTPAFAAPSLETLLKSNHRVVGIVTQPDRPSGRGQTLAASPIKLIAERDHIPVLQPQKMKDPGFLAALEKFNPELITVVAFGRILPLTILQLPPKGCVNVHGSLLPKYRGAGPIQWAIINGEMETGITTMLMDEGMDTGAMLLQASLTIEPDDTAGTLSPKLAELGARLLLETIEKLEAGILVPRPQDHAQATLAPLLKKEDGLLDWSMPALMLANRIRGLSPWPGAFSFLGQDRWVISRAVATDRIGGTPGAIISVTKEAIAVATGEGSLLIQEIQPANSRRMTVAQYLAGHTVLAGMQFGNGA